ncbi:hypothetical protein SAMN04487910_1166 [Aquimarina amphilecti]|uniref:Uncharacterized protein n=1 Tax=Aquimarina amphilecti TaxID=1038014 RepID=A0A1H7K1P1_AQUAM|nr:hypothetical protein [Aquimarina amphilecti]SEK80416.1 hypothetical protein SAMN04487910_1166 [Aquimarina amphilecti]
MKKSFLLIIVSFLIFSCKNEKTQSSDTETTLIRGEFILIDNAGVIKGKDFIYGVIIDDLANELNEKIKSLQREEYDMVPVVIKGIVKKNTEEGWPEVVEIKEIVGVSEPTSELPTKIKSSDSTLQPNASGHEGHNH